MGLFLDAAKAWSGLYNTEYILDIARKGKLSRVNLTFSPEDFAHVAGIQYMGDIDFGIRRTKLLGDRLIKALLHKEFNDEVAKNGRNWGKVAGRFEAVIGIEKILDGSFTIASFDNSRVGCYSQIDADYVIKGQLEDFYFILLDDSSGHYYCKSVFKKEHVDYTTNQSIMTILRKIKVVDGVSTLLYQHPRYEPS